MSVNLIKYSCHNYCLIQEIVDTEVVLSEYLYLWGYREAKIDIVWKYSLMYWAFAINAHTNMLAKDGPGSLPSKKFKVSIGHHFIDYQTLYHKRKTKQVYYGVKQNLKKN